MDDAGDDLPTGPAKGAGELPRALEGTLFGDLYYELRRRARSVLEKEAPSNTSSASLVHELYVRWSKGRTPPYSDAAHFLNLAAQTMRWEVAQRARKARSQTRGGSHRHVSLTDAPDLAGVSYDKGLFDLLALHEALERLDRKHSDLAAIAEMRYFGGLSVDETAELLGIGRKKVKTACGYLRRYLNGGEDDRQRGPG